MGERSWMIYGANGFTGALLAEAAVQRGHRPVLAGRSADKVAKLAERLGLRSVTFDLSDAPGVRRALEGVSLVFHAAGPFIHTAAPVQRACLEAGCHYLDITGEIPVFEAGFALHDPVRARGLTFVSGVGFDVVPTDCLAKHVSDRRPGAASLDLAIASHTSISAGTAKSSLESIPSGSFLRRDGKLVPAPLLRVTRRVRFSDRERPTVAIPWGDLSTAYRSTGIPNITTYLAVSTRLGRALEGLAPVLPAVEAVARGALRVGPLRQAALALAERLFQGPTARGRSEGKTFVWARATDASGQWSESWLEAPEPYQLTVDAGLLAVERVLRGAPAGVLTPSLAFGADFVLEVNGVRRLDALLTPSGGSSS